jgi:ABC-2 type transport system ATP-binding protein
MIETTAGKDSVVRGQQGRAAARYDEGETMAATIEASGVVKRFGKTLALDGLDLVAQHGEILAVLGPNGAGKTTFVRSVATLIRPDEGTLRVFGHDVLADPGAVRQTIGLAGQFAAIEPAMTGRENLEMVARLFGQAKKAARASTQKVLEQMGLAEAADRLARTYSGGMRRKLDLGASLVGSPKLLLLDEPTTGLDPRSRLDLWDAIKSLHDEGTDVLLTTQYLEEADHLASQMIVIDHGKAIATGTPAELKQSTGRSVIEVAVRERDDLAQVAKVLAQVHGGEPQIDDATRRVTISVEGGIELLRDALKHLEALDIVLDDVALRQPKLDEVFLALTGQVLEEEDEPKARKGHGA